MLRLRTLVALAFTAWHVTMAIPTIEIKGSKFFTSNGDQFFIKGVAYQAQNNTNSLTNGAQCRVDAKLIAQLGANVIRVYAIDPTLTITDCMQAFEDEGIYILCDMTTPTYYIDRNDPKWTLELRNQFAKVLDGLHQYDNLLGFFAGNEVINGVNSTIAAPVVKAVIADMKAYRDAMQYRKIPIGYSNNAESIIELMADYMDCGDTDVAVDFFGFNRYSWCGDSSFTASGYDQLYDYADGFDIPIFLSENGCNLIAPRKFTDQPVILGRQMNDRISGNIIYEWINHPNDYGLANYTNSAATGTPSLLPDYSALSSQWATLSPAGVKATSFDPTLTKRACPTFASKSWLVQASEGTNLPTLGLSGFTTPTGPSSARGTSTSTAVGKVPTQPDTSSKTPVGAIVGGVVGGLVVLGLILGGLFLYRRKKKTRQAKSGSNIDGVTAGPDDTAKSGGYYPVYPELSGDGHHELTGTGQTQELDPTKGHTTALGANELPPNPRPEELSNEHERYRDDAPTQNTMHEHDPPRSAEHAALEPSAHVRAQRRREMAWLESEEARMRAQRERLMRQG